MPLLIAMLTRPSNVLNCPAGLALDADGSSVLVADFGNHAVRRVVMAGVVSTVAGNGLRGFDDGEGAAARFDAPTYPHLGDRSPHHSPRELRCGSPLMS